ncbi:hypothetical protein HMPREF3226_01333 [Prevotella corporis]|uniref:Uncharacterized protein n=1 Tax=Prevotella corporis TaxID=28128 RepID=A0A133Q9F2_9BACT|nr:hypothetical protein HMPREF3226_01333 [Prevotella corporis]
MSIEKIENSTFLKVVWQFGNLCLGVGVTMKNPLSVRGVSAERCESVIFAS